MEVLRKITQHMDHCSPCPIQDSKQVPLEYRLEEVPLNQLVHSGPPCMK
jgi:hypothetical protein